MAVTLTASNCPAPVVPAPGVLLSDSNAPPASQEFSTGMAAGFTTKLNRNFKASDLGQSYGAGGYAVGSGLTLSAGTGLQCNVAAGHAVIDGIVELAATSIVVAASSTNWIWLKQDGTLVSQDDTTAKPSGNCVLLGAAVTDGSGVTSIETSGVVYFRGGMLWRQTADTFAPGDSPDSGLRIHTTTAGGEYFWDGAAWREVMPDGSPRTVSQTLAFGAFSAASLTNTINAMVLPAGAVPLAVIARVATAFSGTGVSDLNFEVGITGTDDKYISTLDGTGTNTAQDLSGSVENAAATTQVTVSATATGANLDQLSAGSLVLTVVYARQG